MDAGHKEVIIMGDHLFKPRKFAMMLPNIFNDWIKLLIENISSSSSREVIPCYLNL